MGQVEAVLRGTNRNVSAGVAEGSTNRIVMRAPGEFETPADIFNLIVGAGRDGTPIYMRDIARVQYSFEDEKSKKERDLYINAILDLPGNADYVGAVIAINGKIVNTDIFSSPKLFRKLWPKLVEAYALDAYQAKKDENFEIPSRREAAKFLSLIFAADYKELENPGQGVEYAIESEGYAGTVLINETHALHLALFPFDEPVDPNSRVNEETDIMRLRQIMQQDDVGEIRENQVVKAGLYFEIRNPSDLTIPTAR